MNALFTITQGQFIWLTIVVISIFFQSIITLLVKFGRGELITILRLRKEESIAAQYLRVGAVGYVLWLLVASAFYTALLLALDWYLSLVIGLVATLILGTVRFIQLKRIAKNEDALMRAKLYMDYDLEMPTIRSYSVKRPR
jgi:hypothetical protein